MDIVEKLRTQPPRDLSGLTHDLREDAAKEIERLRGHLQWFCDRVDAGEVRSTQTYNRFKAEL